MMENSERQSDAEAHEPATHQQETEQQSSARQANTLSVVSIGASAGGLNALRSFFSALPHDTGLVFVVIMHLSPDYESKLAELIQPHIQIPVLQITGRTKMQPNHVYVIPPGKRLLAQDGYLELTEFEQQSAPHLQIDDFFASLAVEHGDGVAVILSGTGSDGANGVRNIKEKGGLIFVQSPEEAEFDGMPKSALATGLVDVVGPIKMLAEQLTAAKRTRSSMDLPLNPDEELPENTHQILVQILRHLQAGVGQDFSGYKEATVRRRIARRMQLAHIPTLSAYLEHLRQDNDELEALYRDLLIHVTEFFRDSQAWDYLKHEVIPQLFVDKSDDEPVRVWVVGCATGEEVYGLAILLLEYTETLQNRPPIQLFASDLGEVALDYARAGIYPEAIAANVSEERLERFFEKENRHYRVRKDVRDLVLFSTHNLLQDPPFSRLDLLVCRNLLIYFQRSVQEQVFNCFHYALRPEGYLFLGSAETTEGNTELFEPAHKQSRIYRRSRQTQNKLVLPDLPTGPQVVRPVSPPVPIGQTDFTSAPTEEEHLYALEEVGLPSLLVNEEYHILHHSETAGRFLQHPAGAPTQDVTRLVRVELQNELYGALHHAFEKGQSTRSRPVPVQFNGTPHPVTVLVRPLPNNRRALILFWEEELTEGMEVGTANKEEDTATNLALISPLRAELRSSKQRLQAMYEQYETTVEELRAANEELQSTNEEYRATLEELETSKEELQSINEELHIVNQELKDRIQEINQAHDDLKNFFTSTEIATVFLDRELRVRRYTPRAANIFSLMPSDEGRPIDHLSRNIDYPTLEADARKVISNLAPVEREVQDENGHWFLVNICPYRTTDDKINGVVINFVDVTTNKEIQLSLDSARHFAESGIVHTIPDSLLILDTELYVIAANESFYENFRTTPEQTEGKLLYELGGGHWDIPELRTLLEQVLPDNQSFSRYQIEHNFQPIGRRSMVLNGRRLSNLQRILLTITDITRLKQTEQRLAEMAATQRIHEVSMRLLLETDLDKLLDEILEIAIEILDADMGNMQMMDADTGDLILRGQRGFNEPFLQYFKRLPWQGDTTCANALRTAQRIIVPDALTSEMYNDETARAVLREAGVHGVQSTPLISRGGKLLGVISTHWRTPHTPSTHELRLLDLLARQAADLIERAQAEEALQEWAERLEERVKERTQQVQAIAGEILRIEQQVQQRIALILHDDLQQQLYSTRMQLVMVSDEVAQLGVTELNEAFTTLDSMVGHMIDLTRQITRDLTPPTLHHDDLREALTWLVARMEEMHGLTVRLEVQDNPSLPSEIATLIYHCASELLFNIVKHADVDGAKIRVSQVEQKLEVTVSDQGTGFDSTKLEQSSSKEATSYGLFHMRERLAYQNADLEIETAPGQGTQVRILLPLPDENQPRKK